MAELARPEKIRILFIIDFMYATIAGGTENQLVKLINNLDDEKYDKFLICLRDTPWTGQNQDEIKCSVRVFDYNVENHKDPRNVVEILRLVRCIRSLRPDIAITFFKISNILGVLCARLAGVPRVVSTRRDYGLWLDQSVHLLRLANRFTEGIITNAYKVREITAQAERYAVQKISVIYNGIDAERISQGDGGGQALRRGLGIPSDNSVVGVVAGLRPMKRHDTFLKAARAVVEARSDVSFVLVGDGPLRTEIEAMAKTFGIEGRVILTGPQRDVVPYLSLFDIGINCSANEGLSNAVMEYMAAGIPCIVSNAGGNPELIEHEVNGYVFELGDDEALAALVLRLLEDKGLQRVFTERSKKLIAERFSLEGMIESYDEYFTRCLRCNPKGKGAR